ncbi:MAG: M28 family peptidase [Cyclobacteriaceae bacterium]|nr:M28 family peptidase [Cyclobacteriaceae bacterium HetDA_MAG_MS6]
MPYHFLIPVLLSTLYLHGQQQVDREKILQDVQILSADSLEGRLTGTPGAYKARAYIISRFEEIGVEKVHSTLEYPFTYTEEQKVRKGINVIGKLNGSSDQSIVISAHYDHLGMTEGKVYNGADDNASGVAGILAIAHYFKKYPPKHTLYFAAFDAEENGLRGAKSWVKKDSSHLEKIILNINLDMISRSTANELYACGTHHYPRLKSIIKQSDRYDPVKLKFGHDSPKLGPEDWTYASDHAVFHDVKIPFVYFGVEDHVDYHQPSDTFDKIDPYFFQQSVNQILEAVILLDQNLD